MLIDEIVNAMTQEELFGDVQIVSADNVVRFVYENSESFDDSSLPAMAKNMAPPWDRFWIESRSPSWAFGKFSILHNPRVRFGIFVEAGTDLLSGYHPSFTEQLHQQLSLESIKWRLRSRLFLDYGNGQILRSIIHDVFVSEQGEVNKRTHTQFSETMTKELKKDPTLTPLEIGRQFAHLYIYPLLVSVSFMHCKNVAITENEQPRPERRRLMRAGVVEPVKFLTLNIGPMKNVLKNDGGIQQNGLKKAMHICRGHFATYTEEKPLFGKVSGTFWIPQTLKGNKENGEVKKRYLVHTG